MTLDSDIALLRQIPLFAELPTEQLRLIAFSVARVELAKGQILFGEGNVAQTGYVVLSGNIELAVGQGRRQVTTACGAGSLIGEVALFIETRRPATATATTASELLEIERKLVLRMLNEYPDVAVRMRAILTERLSATVDELSRLRDSLAEDERRGGRR